jgi:hypothetical protein
MWKISVFENRYLNNLIISLQMRNSLGNLTEMINIYSLYITMTEFKSILHFYRFYLCGLNFVSY